jgi:malate:Na+ symporter
MPMLDGVPVIAPIIMPLVVIFVGAFDAIPANMIGGLAVIFATVITAASLIHLAA